MSAESELRARPRRVFVLGGTGSIGAPVVQELVRYGHDVLALARSEPAAAKLATLGARVVRGDITAPGSWLGTLAEVDAVVQAAAGFGDDDEAVERRLLDALLPALAASGRAPRLIYTGGCWLYGEGRGTPTSEESPFDPLPALAWGPAHVERVLRAPGIETVVVHPAMVYTPQGGVFARFRSDAITRDAVRVVGAESVRWPLVHSADLATLYRYALERSAAGESYLGVAIEELAVGRIARAYARRHATRREAPEVCSVALAVAELGAWAAGYARDQCQSGAKARHQLGWQPRHLDSLGEIARGA